MPVADCYRSEHASGLHRIGARPGNALEFIRSFDAHRSIAENAVISFQQRWYGDVKQKYAAELTRHFARRFSVETPSFSRIRRFVLNSDPVTFPLVNHFFMLLSDPLYRWGAAGFVAPRYAQGREKITNATFVPELRPHLPATIGTRTALRYGQSILTALRDNGVLTGLVRKTITPPELSLRQLAFFLYYHAECGIGVGEFESTPLFTSLMRPREFYVPLFREGERRGFWAFAGDTSRLSAHLSFSDLESWLDGLDGPAMATKELAQ
jgi:hypothetical protein